MAFLSDMRNIAKDSIVYGLSSSLSRMVTLITAPIVTRILEPADYGVVSLVQLAIGFFVIIAGMNIGSGLSYYYYEQKNKQSGQENIVLTSGLYIAVIFSIFISGVAVYFAPSIAAFLEMRADGSVSDYDLITFIRLAAAGMFFSLIIVMIQTILRLWRKPVTFLRLEALNVVLNVALILYFVVWARYGVIGIFWAGVIAPAATMMMSLYTVRSLLVPKISFPILALVFAYCLPQMPGLFVNWAQTQLGRWFINYFASLSELGLYSIAFSIASIVMLAISAFRMAYGPYSLSIMDRDDAKEIYAKTYSLFSAIFIVLAGGIAAFSKLIFIILTDEIYHSAFILVPYLVIAAFYMGANNILATGIWISKKTSYTSVAQLASFTIMVSMSIILVPPYGALGAAIAFMLASITQSFSYYFFAQRLWYIPYDFWRSHIVVCFVLSLCIAHNILIEESGLLYSLISSRIVSIFTIVLVWILGVSKPDKQLILSTVSKWIREKGYKVGS